MQILSFPAKSTRWITVLLISLFFSVNLVAQSTITSTASGGLWNATTTWEGGIVPSASNHVVINGPVNINGEFTCNNLTINAAGTIKNQYANSPTFTVNGKITNHGIITRNPDGFSLYLKILGDIENNGTWTPDETYLSGNSDQNLKEASGKSFQGYFQTTDNVGQIVLGSDVTFNSNRWDWNQSQLRTNGYKLNTLNCQLNNGNIISDDNLVLKNTGIASMTFNGNYKISGKLRVQRENIFNGTATVLDTLYNDYAFSPILTINGKIINQGIISRNPSGFDLIINAFGDIENNGTWTPGQTSFLGDSDRRLKEAAGKSLQGYLFTSDSIGEFILDSNVLLAGNTWDMNKCKVITNGFNLITQNCILNNGKILSNESLVLKNTAIAAMNINGNYSVAGKVRVRGDNVFNGMVTVLDTLLNDYAFTPTLTVNAKIINNGSIINNPNGFSFYMNIFNDIENNGKWAPQQTTFSGKTDQRLKEGSGKSFQGYVLTTDSIGEIILDSNVLLDGNTWDMNKCTVTTHGFNLITQNCILNNGKILSNESLILKNTAIAAMTFNGNYSVAGKVRVRLDNVFNGMVTVIDTLLNDYAFSPTLTVNAKIINNGSIINNPNGFSFYLNIFNDIENNGLWAPQQTTFSGKTDQRLKQVSGKSFQGYMLTTDSIGEIILDSNVLFDGNTWDMNKCQLQTNKFNLLTRNYFMSNGKILSNDTLLIRNSRISGMTFNGDYKIGGKVGIQDGIRFNGTVTVLDTLYNQYAFSPTAVFSGKLINNGTIASNPSGFSLSLRISGNLENNNKINVSAISLTGTNDKTISGRNINGTLGNFYADDAITLIGDNILPNINFTGNPASGCTIKQGATLTLTFLPNSSKLKNYGRITVVQDVDNTANNTYNFYAASVSTKVKTVVGKLTVDNYGYQQHPTATGTINTWWRLRNTPQTFNDTLNWLKLTYLEDALNGNLEDSIKVFHSPNAGLSWKRIKKGYTIDKVNHAITINNAPSFGHYLLSSTALGITSFQPLVESAEPRYGGNTGQLSMYLFGAGFKTTSTVKLKLAGQNDVPADTTYLTDALGESMLAQFDLKDKGLGVYDVIIETPGEPTLTLPGHFTVMTGERSEPWSTLSGRDRFLINRWQTFNIGYGNTANTDALGTILVYVVNDLPGLEVEFPDIKVVLPKAIADMGPDFTRFRNIGLYYPSETLTGYEGQKMRVYPFYIPYIAAGSSKNVRVRVRLNGTGTLKMDSWLLDPLFEKIDYDLKSADMPNEVRLCITVSAMRAFSNGAAGLLEGIVPGAACWGVIDKTVKPAEYFVTKDELPEGETYADGTETWGSYLWNGVSIMASAVQCGASFVPGLGTGVSLGIGLVNMAIDMKDGYDATEGCWRKFRKKSQGKLNSRGVTSFDPNEKIGPRGFTSEHYISKEGNLNYTIFFENKKTAEASALEVFVKDTLDVTKFDFKTFSFSSVTFGETTAKVQEYAKEFQLLVDLYPTKDIIVQVHGALDTIKGIVSWDFHSLDRITMELTEDPDLGFLPPNVTGPEGEGNVTYSCKLKNTVVHDDLISNRASIVFDFNAPILTNTYTNRIDDRIPVSTVTPLYQTQYDSTFVVSWSGNDLGSEISKYSIFVSTNNSEYMLWKVASAPSAADFIGKNGSTYKFYSLATDSIGFTETRKVSPEATTTLDVKVGINPINANGDLMRVFPNPAEKQCSVMFNFPTPTEVSISLVDISGKRIITIEKQKYQAGKQVSVLNLNGIPNGLYVVKLFTNSKTYFQKLVVRN